MTRTGISSSTKPSELKISMTRSRSIARHRSDTSIRLRDKRTLKAVMMKTRKRKRKRESAIVVMTKMAMRKMATPIILSRSPRTRTTTTRMKSTMVMVRVTPRTVRMRTTTGKIHAAKALFPTLALTFQPMLLLSSQIDLSKYFSPGCTSNDNTPLTLEVINHALCSPFHFNLFEHTSGRSTPPVHYSYT